MLVFFFSFLMFQLVHVQVRAGNDDSMLMSTLHDYLTDNEGILRQLFKDNDLNGNGANRASCLLLSVTQPDIQTRGTHAAKYILYV